MPAWKRRSSSAATLSGSAIATISVERPSISIGIAPYFLATSSLTKRERLLVHHDVVEVDQREPELALQEAHDGLFRDRAHAHQRRAQELPVLALLRDRGRELLGSDDLLLRATDLPAACALLPSVTPRCNGGMGRRRRLVSARTARLFRFKRSAKYPAPERETAGVSAARDVVACGARGLESCKVQRDPRCL